MTPEEMLGEIVTVRSLEANPYSTEATLVSGWNSQNAPGVGNFGWVWVEPGLGTVLQVKKVVLTNSDPADFCIFGLRRIKQSQANLIGGGISEKFPFLSLNARQEWGPASAVIRAGLLNDAGMGDIIAFVMVPLNSTVIVDLPEPGITIQSVPGTVSAERAIFSVCEGRGLNPFSVSFIGVERRLPADWLVR